MTVHFFLSFFYKIIGKSSLLCGLKRARMSVVTGSKGEKGTKKFQSLNINTLYQVSL